MFEDYLREIPKNPLLSSNSNLGDLGTPTTRANSAALPQTLVITDQDIPQDLQVLINSLPALDTPVLSGGSAAPNLAHLIATLQQQTENQQYKQKMQILQNAYNLTSAKNANALMLMDNIFNTAAQGNICTQTGIVMGYLLAAKEAGVSVEKYLADQNITITPELRAMLDIAEAEIKKAPDDASLSTIVSNILASAGEATQTTFTQEELDKYSSEISAELMEVHSSGEEAREAHQGEVDTANANMTAAESDKAGAQQALTNTQEAQKNAEDNLQTLKDDRKTLETKKENAQTAYNQAQENEKVPQANVNQAQTDLNNAQAAQKDAAKGVADANNALQAFDTANGDPEKLTDTQKAERQQLVDNLNAAKTAKTNADQDVTDKKQALKDANKVLKDAQAVTASMQEELNKATTSLNNQDTAIAAAETAVTQAKAATAAAEISLAQKTQALTDAELAVKAATTAQQDAAMAAINEAFGEYVDACVAMGLMEAEKRQEQKRIDEQDEQKRQLAEEIDKYIRKMNLPIKTSPEQLAEILTALMDSQMEFLDMMNKTENEKKEIDREIYQKETI